MSISPLRNIIFPIPNHNSNQFFSSFSLAQFHFSSSTISICFLFWIITFPIHVKPRGLGKTSSIEPTYSADDTFIINLISQERFSECSVFVIQDRFDNGHSVDRILSRVSSFPSFKSAYSIKYTFPSNSSHQEDVSSSSSSELEDLSKLYLAEEEDYMTDYMSAYPLRQRFPISTSNYHRRSDPCLMVILLINDLRPGFIRQIHQMFTPIYIPIARKDEDFYIFKAHPRQHQELLLMPEFPNRIKFKIAVGVDDEPAGSGVNNLYVRTVCFFCEPGGYPRLLQLPVSKRNMPVAGVDYFPDFVLNLNGKLLRVSFPNIIAKVEGDPPYEGTCNARRGAWKYLFEKFLMIKFNFTYNMFASSGRDGRPGGGGTGLQLENGTWIGVTGDVYMGKADLGIVVANTPKRIYYIDYGLVYFDAGQFTFVTAQPTRIYSLAAFLWPFDSGMWAGIGVSVILSTIFFLISTKIMEVWEFPNREKWPLGLQFKFFFSSFLEQDSPVLPESHSLRCFVALWFLYTMVLINVYRSKMVELLAFPVLGTLPKTFQELAFSDYKIGFMKHGDSGYNTLAASTDPVYVKLVAEMEIFRGVGLGCLEKVFQEKYACIAYDFALVHLTHRNLSETDTMKMVVAPAKTYNVWLGLGTEGKGIYRINFGRLLGYARMTFLAQIYDKWDMYYNVRLLKRQWWKDTGQMDKARHAEEASDDLTFKQMAGTFYVLIALLIVSTIVFLVEYFTYHKTSAYYWIISTFYKSKKAISLLFISTVNNIGESFATVMRICSEIYSRSVGKKRRWSTRQI